MIIAFTGAHRTGKTTVLDLIRARHPQWNYLSEPARNIAPVIGFDDPPKFLQEHGIAMLEAIQISMFSALDPVFNPLLSQLNGPLIIDRCPIDYFSYFELFSTDLEARHRDLLFELAEHFQSNIDHHIYFPLGAFDLPDVEGDPQGKALQVQIDTSIQSGLKRHQASVFNVTEHSPEQRVEEVTSIIANLIKA